MSSILRINSITSRSGINTLDFTGNGFSYVTDVGFGTTSPRGKLDVQGTFLANGGNAGIGTTLPTSRLDVVGDVQVSGVVTATSFRGDGSNLTGVAATSNIRTNAIVNSGVTTVSAGTTAIPSISPSGDSNTGIFFPEADTVAIGEGGAEALRVRSTGQVIIGTEDFPRFVGAKVGIHTNASGNSSATHMLRIQQHNENTLDFLMWSNQDLCQIAATNNEQNLSIVSANLSTISATDINGIYIQNAATGGGRVGVGTTVATARLTVAGGGGNGGLRVLDSDPSFSAGSPCALLDFDGTTVRVGHVNGASGSAKNVQIISGGDAQVEISNAAIFPVTDNALDLGTSAKRWANIFSADLQLSNEGSQNEVDGTWGKYTIQEGENDLFLINRRNGKKYKFVLQEVN